MEVADQLHKDSSEGCWTARVHGCRVTGDAQHRAPGWALAGVTLIFFFESRREKTDLGMSSCVRSGKKTLLFLWLGVGA